MILAIDWSNPFYVDAIWLSIAFVCGLFAKRIGLPPLVGFLVAGFMINGFGYHDGKINGAIEGLADIGVMLLLFTIGLKLKIKSLLKKEIWATASLHMIVSVLLFSGFLLFLSYFGFALFTEMSWQSALLISFALSFSSTVFVVKTLEDRGEFNAYHGKIAIGILIIQDIFAVLFIALSDNKLPSIWVLALPIVLFVIRWLLGRLLSMLEHGEMVPVFGFFATFIAGAFSFSLFGLKPDLGALVIGMLLVNHPKADELYGRMSEYKDFFLIAFFIHVGLIGLPNSAILITASVLIPLILLKASLFLFILSRFDLRPRTSYLSALSLGNYSEFGLIVGVIGLNRGLIAEEWVVVMALLMSISFVISAPLNARAHEIFDTYKTKILRLNQVKDSIDSEPVDFEKSRILVVGLGSIGEITYASLFQKFGDCVMGLDYNHDKIENMANRKWNVKWADTTDSELWDHADCQNIEAVFLTMGDFASNSNTLKEINRLKNRNFKVFAISHFPDQTIKYNKQGADYVFEYKESLGKDFVDNALEHHHLKSIK